VGAPAQPQESVWVFVPDRRAEARGSCPALCGHPGSRADTRL